MNSIKKKIVVALLLASSLMTGCAKTAPVGDTPAGPAGENGTELAYQQDAAALDGVQAGDEEFLLEEIEIEDMDPALADMPKTMLLPVASGTSTKKAGGAEIDYSNIADGYVMARFASTSTSRLKVQVAGPSTTYTYDLPTGAWVTFPLSDGNGQYKTSVFQNTTGKKYAVLATVSFNVTLKDEFAPFLRPNQYVDYSNATNTVAKAEELTKGLTKTLDKVAAVYDYVVANMTYDKQKAATVQSGYLPNLDSVLAAKKGICFDYAALMTGMLRSQGVPCKMVIGYAGTAYHAWVSVWTEDTGWVDGVIFFDGKVWQRMDPTFASTGNSSDSVMKYIGDGSNYTTKYLY